MAHLQSYSMAATSWSNTAAFEMLKNSYKNIACVCSEVPLRVPVPPWMSLPMYIMSILLSVIDQIANQLPSKSFLATHYLKCSFFPLFFFIKMHIKKKKKKQKISISVTFVSDFSNCDNYVLTL